MLANRGTCTQNVVGARTTGYNSFKSIRPLPYYDTPPQTDKDQIVLDAPDNSSKCVRRCTVDETTAGIACLLAQCNEIEGDLHNVMR